MPVISCRNTGNRILRPDRAAALKLIRMSSERCGKESTGIRSQVIAMTAAALAPDLFSEIAVRQGAKSLQIVLDAPISYLDAPDLFCPDLYKRFDLDQLRQLAGSTRYTGLP